MRSLGAICAAMIFLQGLADLARAQEPAPVPSQNPAAPAPPTAPTAPAPEETERTAKETKKLLEQLACGPSHVKLVHHTETGTQPLPDPPLDKSLIYVLRTKTLVGSAEQANFAMDGKWVGVNRRGNYFFLETVPGPHYFCLKFWGGAPPGLLSMVTEKGKTYYLRQVVTLGGGIEIDLLDEKEGKLDVAQYRRSSFEEKQKK